MKEENGSLRVLRVEEGGSAQNAGLAAEDQIIAVEGIRLPLEKFEKQLSRIKIGDSLVVHAFRRDELHRFEVSLLPAIANTVELSIDQNNESGCLAWLRAD